MYINSKKGASLIENVVYLYIVQLANYILPLLTIPFLTNRLGLEGFGAYAVIQTVIVYGQVITDYGFAVSATRRIANEVALGNLPDCIFSSVLSVRVILSLFAFIILLSFLYAYSPEYLNFSVIFAMFICLISQAFTCIWLYQGLQSMKLVSIFIFLSRILSLIATILIVDSPNDVDKAIWSQVFGALMLAILSLFHINRLNIKYTVPPLKSIVFEIKDSWSIFQSVLSGYLLVNSGIIILGLFAPIFIVGGYSVVERIARAASNMLTPVTQAIFPQTASRFAISKKTGVDYLVTKGRLVMTYATFLCLLLTILPATSLVEAVFGAEFTKFSSGIYFFVPWVFFGILNNLLGIQLMANLGQSAMYAKFTTFVSIVGIFLYFILIPRYSYYGIPISLAVAEVSLSVLMSIYVFRHIRVIQRGGTS